MPPPRLILVVTSLIGLLHAYVGLRLLPALDLGGAGTAIGIFLLALCTLLIPFGLLARALQGRMNEGLALSWDIESGGVEYAGDVGRAASALDGRCGLALSPTRGSSPLRGTCG